jgi:hypothetical protein
MDWLVDTERDDMGLKRHDERWKEKLFGSEVCGETEGEMDYFGDVLRGGW